MILGLCYFFVRAPVFLSPCLPGLTLCVFHYKRLKNAQNKTQINTTPQIGKIRLPVSDYPVALTNLQFWPTNTPLNQTLSAAESATAAAITRARNRHWMTFDSSFIVYMIALVSFVGWFLFAVRFLRCMRAGRPPTAPL